MEINKTLCRGILVAILSLAYTHAQTTAKQSVGSLLRSEFYGTTQKIRNAPNEPWHSSSTSRTLGTLSTTTQSGSTVTSSSTSPSSSASPTASASASPSSSSPSSSSGGSSTGTVPPPKHEHYKAQMGLSCLLQKDVKVTVKDDSGKMVTLACSDPVLQLSDLVINEVRGPFCACVKSAEEYCEMKRLELREMTGDTLLEMEQLGLSPCYKCGDVYCNASYFLVDGSCSQP